MVRLDKLRFISLISFIVIILDQFTKLIIRSSLSPGESIPIIKNIFHITYATNTGAGFGIFQGYNFFLILVSLLAFGIIVYLWKEIPKERFGQFLIALILGGLFGNLIDRIFLGYVVDMYDFMIWPAFNIADSSITMGVMGLILHELFKKHK